MKLSLATIALVATSVSAFIPSNPSFVARSSASALNASKNKVKIVSRTKWAESRGISSVVADSTSSSTGNILTNDKGLEYIKLKHGDSSADVYLYGGVVTSYIKEGIEYIAVRPDAKMDGSKPISGGLSHCWPQFGPGAIQQHGFARNLKWNVDSVTDNSCVLTLLPSEETRAMWDKDFKCTFTVSLNDEQLDTKMHVANTGSGSFDFQAALHSYFTVSSLENLQIAGSFAGKEFLNKMTNGGTIQTEARSIITIASEYDRVYKGVNDPVLIDQGTGKKLAVLNTAGWEDTVLWNPYGNEGMGFNNFVCVESVKFDPVTLNGGSTWVGDMSLKPSNI